MDIFPLFLCDPQRAAVLCSKLPVVGHFNRECIGTPIVDWYTRDPEIRNRKQYAYAHRFPY